MRGTHLANLALASILALLSLAVRADGNASALSSYFRIAQDQNQRWWFVDPSGKPFFSTGVNVVDPDGDTELVTHRKPYRENWEKKMDLAGWVSETSSRLEDWGFNTLGGWSVTDLFNDHFVYAKIVGCRAHFGHYAQINPLSRFNIPLMPLADYFDPAYAVAADQAAEIATQGRVQDQKLLGYFLDNEMDWGRDFRQLLPAYDYFFNQKGSPAKAEIMRLLMQQYSDDSGPQIELLNLAWGTAYPSFDALAAADQLPASYLRSKAIQGDRSRFLKSLAEKYYSVCSAAIRKRDPNHLLLGERAMASLSQPEVIEAAGETQDVLSVNYYINNQPTLDLIPVISPNAVSMGNWLLDFHRLSGLPILISEFGFRTFGIMPPLFTWAITQRQRAGEIQNYIQRSWATPYILGYHDYLYADQPMLGRADFEDNQCGLVNESDKPYGPVTDVFKQQAQIIAAAEPAVKFPNGPNPLRWMGPTADNLDPPSKPAPAFKEVMAPGQAPLLIVEAAERGDAYKTDTLESLIQTRADQVCKDQGYAKAYTFHVIPDEDIGSQCETVSTEKGTRTACPMRYQQFLKINYLRFISLDSLKCELPQ
jgi:agarase